jgi:uncharacterized protein
MDRRSFLKSAAATAAATVPLNALIARTAHAHEDATYGPLVPVNDQTTGLPLLMLPEGFTYLSFGWRGDLLGNGTPTPGAHDGMAAFPAGRGRVHLVRNHEVGRGTPFSSAAYDAQAGGGTTTLVFDSRHGRLVEAYDSISGTLRNCAGGVTPWGSWLTCEETTEFTPGTSGKPHGYTFEVPERGLGDPEPIRDMGRFSHEANAIDPKTGWIYETEDAGDKSGFYRFVPHLEGDLAAGGRLFMLKVRDVDQANLKWGQTQGATYRVAWVRIMTPDDPSPTMPADFVWAQGWAQGAATFGRLEGCWYGNRRIYIVSTNGGGPTATQSGGQGQIWEYDPKRETIRLIFQSPGADVLNAPDNITVSPRGGLVLCEDGSGVEYLHGLTVDGEIFRFAQNNVKLNGERNGITGDFTGAEWAGACYSPDGRWLFANIQSPGISFAITGPWKDGAL